MLSDIKQTKFRQAQKTDLAALVQLLAKDTLGSLREDTSTPLNDKYLDAFAAIDRDPNNKLIVVEYDKILAGMLQLTFIPYLTHKGSWRCLIEGVRIHEDFRSQGLGEKLFEYAIQNARAQGCNLVQLTSDKQRPDAIRFYQKLGFLDSHEGFKLAL